MIITNLGPNSELLEGTRFLGQPLGNNAFAARCFAAKASEYTSASSRILDRLHDTQTQCTLYKNCAQATIPHLLASDVYQHIDLTAPPLLQTWDSPFLASILNTNHHFLLSRTMLNSPAIPVTPTFVIHCILVSGKGRRSWSPRPNNKCHCFILHSPFAFNPLC
jgi:hypothetical protein